mmetsp:Transcript_42118/g.82601  ORF Transcript_42118/g.82601 Transcript_42118/m.82601 type:complete len:266 (-) Transcript_42118:218-1015(-)
MSYVINQVLIRMVNMSPEFLLTAALAFFRLPNPSLGFLVPLSQHRPSHGFRRDALPKERLIELTKEYLAAPSPDWWSDDFVLRGPVIGPLCKTDIIATLSSVRGADGDRAATMADAFPDLQENAFGFTADDPIEPGRVWYFVRPRGTFTGPFDHPVVGRIEPTGAAYVAPPEVRSVIFDAAGKVRYQSVGYVTDRFTGDTTGGRGAVFGQYAVMGQEIDATIGSPVTVALQKLTMMLPDGKIPKSYSRKEDIPGWWTDPRMGAEK